MKQLFFFLFSIISLSLTAQVKIGNNPGTINSNSLLELESTNKGFLPPRIALDNASSISPLTGTVPSGMMVYSSGGMLADGYYYWNGTSWRLLETSELNAVAKSSSVTLTKAENMVLASGNTTLTLPVITASDNGLAITVKNTGIHTDLVTVQGTNPSKIDGIDNATLTRWQGRTFIAYNGHWVSKTKDVVSVNVLDVSPTGSWTTVQEVIDYLNMHMSGPTVVRLAGPFTVDATVAINLAHPVTFQGISYGEAVLSPGASLSGNPMFQCTSEAYFKMLQFDAGSGGYGGSSGEDAIQLLGSGEYFEVKDCNFTGFNKTIAVKSNVELWLFETDINDAVAAGVEIDAAGTDDAVFKVSETDFINCAKGINLVAANKATVSILNCGFYNGLLQTGIVYFPAAFTNFSSMFITNNSWNNTGTFVSGFDFTRTDGRDSKAFLQNNAGDGDKNPNFHINVLNSATTTALGAINTWVKVNWNHSLTTTTTTMWTVDNSAAGVNKVTYQPANRRGGHFIITGNLSVNQASRTISLGIVKKGASGVRYGETTIRTGTQNTPTLFSTIVYLGDIAPGDWFEIYISSTSVNDIVTIQDLQWFADTK
jgi:hypothetical protein